MVLSYNPGYQSIVKDLKQSTKQRFAGFEFDYPGADVERGIIVGETGVDEDTAGRLVQIAETARNLKGHGLAEGISTRLLVYAATLIGKGMEPAEAARMAMVVPLTDDADIRDTLVHAIDTVFG
jgi:nitric oxide reductase NorQ protein